MWPLGQEDCHGNTLSITLLLVLGLKQDFPEGGLSVESCDSAFLVREELEGCHGYLEDGERPAHLLPGPADSQG